MKHAMTVLAVLAGVASLPGCGSRSAAITPDVGETCPIPTALSAQTCRISDDDRCVMSGTDSVGARHVMDCNGTTCAWSVDGRVTCTCTQLDYGNVCPNSVPTCATWSPPATLVRPPFNWNSLVCSRD